MLMDCKVMACPVGMATERQLPALLKKHGGQLLDCGDKWWGGEEGNALSLSPLADSDSHSTILLCRFPQPQLPALHLLPQVLGDTVALTFVAYAISVSLAMIYAEKHHYAIDPNQVCGQPGELGSPQGWDLGPGQLPSRNLAPLGVLSQYFLLCAQKEPT